ARGDMNDLHPGHDLDSGIARGAGQRIEHGARTIAHRKQLAALFALQHDAELIEELHRLVDGKRAHYSYDPIPITVEVGDLHALERELQLTTVADQHLRAELFRAVDGHHACAWTRPRREQRSHQAGCAGTYDRYVIKRLRHRGAVYDCAILRRIMRRLLSLVL